jgi:integrase/recombinase XerD
MKQEAVLNNMQWEAQMNKPNFLSPWIKKFLLEYLITVCNLSRNTQKSYRDTFRLCIPYFAKRIKKSFDQLIIEDLSTELVKDFLSYLELERNCSLMTRNQRLAALHAFAKFLGLNSPEHTEWCRQIRLIPFKKTKHSLISYLEKIEIDALLNAPDRTTEQGKRDYTLLLFLYNTGARADEAAQLKNNDLAIALVEKRNHSSVLIKGKGNKLRQCPLWKETANEISLLINKRASSEHVFLNRCQQPLTRFGIHGVVKRYVDKIIPQFPLLQKKRVSPHTIRHTTATHLLRAGVDINTIRAWLGHVSINTTNIYAEVDLEMKVKALACCEIKDSKITNNWKDCKNLISFLNSL